MLGWDREVSGWDEDEECVDINDFSKQYDTQSSSDSDHVYRSMGSSSVIVG